MKKDFELRIQPVAGPGNEGLIQLAVRGVAFGFPEQGEVLGVQRPLSVLDREDLEELLRGELVADKNRELFDKITAAVSDWLHNVDLPPLLNHIIRNLGNDQLRIIFSVDESIKHRFNITEVPVELARPVGRAGQLPYALSKTCASIFHAETKHVSQEPANFNWPLRVLFVRSNPPGLSEAVPEAIPIIYKIQGLAVPLGGASAVQIDLLSTESPAAPYSPTWAGLREQLRREDRKPYHILVYLGHCALKQVGTERIGHLQMETLNGDAHEDIPPETFVLPFEDNPVPVVLLVGCMTAAALQEQEPEKRESTKQKITNWIRGSQSVAQALISSVTAGVKVVVGMRYRMDSVDAETFLISFFKSLLHETGQKGDVEAALRFARKELSEANRYLGTYSAPVIFREVRDHLSNAPRIDEPLFEFLNTTPPPSTICEKPVGNWRSCRIIWDDLQTFPWSKRSSETRKSLLQMLEKVEADKLEAATRETPFVMARWVVVDSDKPAFLKVNLYGSLTVKSLAGILYPDSKAVTFTAVEESPTLSKSGFKLHREVKSNQITFRVESIGKKEARLPEGPLFEVSMKLGAETSVRYMLNTGHLVADPPQPVCPGVNVVIVPPP